MARLTEDELDDLETSNTVKPGRRATPCVLCSRYLIDKLLINAACTKRPIAPELFSQWFVVGTAYDASGADWG